jgi:acyl-CoA thioester hydrolase
MQRFYEGTVKPEQIDNLGHMNVRFYGVIAASAADALVAALGLESDALGELNARLLTSEAYTRFHREQLDGARLAVRGGVLVAEKTALDIYLELINDESGEVSATYRQKLALVDLPTHKPVAFPEELIAEAEEQIVELPPHGRPRSLPWGGARTDLTLAEFQERGVVGSETYTVEEGDCDEHGFLRLQGAHGLAFVGRMHVHRLMRRRFRGGRGVPVFEHPGGQRVGSATAETRLVVLATPRVGDTLRTFTAYVQIERKIQQSAHWTFNTETGALLGVNNQLNIAFDLARRRSTELPAEMRANFEANYHPDLR